MMRWYHWIGMVINLGFGVYFGVPMAAHGWQVAKQFWFGG